MNRILVIVFLISTFASFGQSPSDQKKINIDSLLHSIKKKESEAIGKQFPDFKVILNNTQYSNQNLKGKIVFINFWFATCQPCLAELDELNKLYQKFKDNTEFKFISFTFEDSSKIESIKKTYEINYDIFSISKDECYRLNFNNGFPTSIILDKENKISLLHTGGSMIKNDIEKYFFKKYYPLITSLL